MITFYFLFGEGSRKLIIIIFGRGRFLTPVCADDVMFGNTFDRPLKLPWGSGAALKFMQYVSDSPLYGLAQV